MGIKSKLAMAAATSAVGAAMVAGGTFALFTDSTSNTGNTFTAGTVKITDTTGGPVASQAQYFSNLAPGDHGTVHMTVQNTGNLDEWVKIDQDLTAHSETGSLFGGTNPMSLSPSNDVVKLAPGASYTFDIDYSFPLAADNSYQSATGSFSVYVDAVQARNNTNSAGNGPQDWS